MTYTLRPLFDATVLPMLLVVGLCGCAGPRGNSAARLSPAPEDTVFNAAVKRASDSFAQGQYANAVSQYTDALNRARMLDKPAAAASAGYNLSACYAATRDYVKAQNCLIETRADFERIGDLGGMGETWLLEAKIAQVEKRYQEAEVLCDRALELFEESGGQPMMEAHGYVLKAYLLCEADDTESAQQALDAATRTGAPGRDPLLLAELLSTEGHVMTAEKNYDRAAIKYDAAAVAYRNISRASDVANMLSKAADIYRLSGRHGIAGERFYRAARSLYAQGNIKAALNRLELAFASAKLVDDIELNERCTALFSTMKSHVEAAKAASENTADKEGPSS